MRPFTPEGTRMAAKSHKELAEAIAARMRAKLDADDIRIDAFARRLEMSSAELRKHLNGSRLPTIPKAMAFADRLGVTLDWLILGREPTPAAFEEWLATSVGRAAPEAARQFLRALPLRGYQPSVAFYTLAYQAWEVGLKPDETVASAKAASGL